MYIHPQTIQDVDEFVSSSEQIWVGVQTADKMDMTPVQQLSLNSQDILSVDVDVNGQQGMNFLEEALL